MNSLAPLTRISAFKSEPHPVQVKDPAVLFYSSGTTQSQKSISPFSSLGVKEYRISVLESFSNFVMPRLNNHRLLTLIPPDQAHSSLSMMSRFLIDEFKFQSVSSITHELVRDNQPVFAFATLLQWIDHAHITLPEGSILMETGGLKKRFDSLNKSVEFQKLYASFQPKHIISEYGMAELASQAYAIDQSSYRFSPWVNLRVLFQDRLLHKGRGLLVIQDPRRIDFPSSIITEDLVELYEDQSFIFIERLEIAPLKGCSLQYEKLCKAPSRPNTTREFITNGASDNEKRANHIHNKIQEALSSTLLQQMMAEISGSTHEAKMLCDITLKCLPKDSKAWCQAASQATQDTADNWLMIAANNHPISILYPLAMAYVAGKKLWIRSRYEPFLKEFEPFFCGFFPFQKSLQEYDLRQIDSILAFGANETLAELRSHTDLPIKGFGSRLCASLFQEDNLGNALQLVLDMYLMAQRGCQSSRALLCTSTPSPQWIKNIQNTFDQFWNAPWTLQQQCALDYEKYRLKELGCEILSDGPLLIARSSLCNPSVIPQSPFCLLILDHAHYLEQLTNNERVAFDNIYYPSQWGTAHLLHWTGMLHDEPLFGGNVIES